jgi:hypothetical protein
MLVDESAAPVKGCRTVKNGRRKRGRRRGQHILEPFSALMLRILLWLVQANRTQSAGRASTWEEPKGYEEKQKKTRGKVLLRGRDDDYAFCRRSRKVETSSSPLRVGKKDGG